VKEMNKPKFKIGDKVRVLDGSKIEGYIGGWASEGMDKYVGKICTIKDVRKDFQDEVQYTLNCEGIIEHSDYGFDERGLELAEQEAAPKFKVGDMVKIINSGNKEMIGKTALIVEAVDMTPGKIASRPYKISIDGKERYYTEDHLELVPASQKIIITTDGKTTLARLYEEKKVVKSAESHCSPDDEFDFSVGANLAMERLIGKATAIASAEIPKEITDKLEIIKTTGKAFLKALEDFK